MAVRMTSGSGSAGAARPAKARQNSGQAGDAPALAGGDEMGVRKAETGEVRCGGFGIKAVDLVDHQHHAPPAAPQVLGDGLIARGQPGPGIDQEEHAVGIGQGHLGLLADEFGKLAVRTESAGVDQHARLAAQQGATVAPVPR